MLKEIAIFCIVERIENCETDLAAIKTSKDLLDYLDKKYLAFHNVIFLQGLFLASQAPELYNICTDYAKGKEKKITYFEQRILGKGKKSNFYDNIKIHMTLNFTVVYQRICIHGVIFSSFFSRRL